MTLTDEQVRKLYDIAMNAKQAAEDPSLYENELFADVANGIFEVLGADERATGGGV